MIGTKRKQAKRKGATKPKGQKEKKKKRLGFANHHLLDLLYHQHKGNHILYYQLNILIHDL